MYERIEKLRNYMISKEIAACIIPTSDPHLSEYTSDFYKFREWLSGFTGSAGTLVVTKYKAGLWTDGRYYIQAEKELEGSGITLFRASEKETPKITDFISENVEKGTFVGVDGRLFSKNALDKIKVELVKNEIILKPKFYASVIWKEKDQMPMGKAFLLEEKYSGERVLSKIKRLRERLCENEVDYYVTAATDSVMWLLNIRGCDVLHTPVMLSYLFVSNDKVILFANKEKVSDVSDALHKNNIKIYDYDKFYEFLASLDKEKKLALDFDETNYEIVNCASCSVINKTDFIKEMKSVKNNTEIENIKKAYVKENIALIKSFFEIYSFKTRLSECDVADIIEKHRKAQDGYLYPSFETIAAYGKNAAMMHYSPQKGSCAIINKEEMLLIDTGGQYLEGTTDTTRTLVFDEMDSEVKKLYTLVLKGNIALSMAVFMEGTTGRELDILAREPLWEIGKDYRCSTGHGVGYLLCVHEGPHRISPSSGIALKPNMTVTDEPGVYEENQFGIRIENHLCVTEKYSTDYGKFLGFEVLNFCPIGTNALDVGLLSEKEKNFVNEYNQKCLQLYKKYLTMEEYEWLINYAKKI